MREAVISVFKHKLLLMVLCLSAITISGCAEIDPFEATGEAIRHPLGQELMKTGMTKEEVISKWGEADIVRKLGTTDVSGTRREEWLYKAKRFTPVPIDAGYLYKSKYLYFDGNNLTSISDEPK